MFNAGNLFEGGDESQGTAFRKAGWLLDAPSGTVDRSSRFDVGGLSLLIRDMSDGIIDIRQYLEVGEDDPSAFALWGGEGERSRFALPLWRIIYLAGGDRGGIVSAPDPRSRKHLRVTIGLESLVVLDLRQDPARTDFDVLAAHALQIEESPKLVDLSADGLLVSLGESVGRSWFVVVHGIGGRTDPLTSDVKEDILFLSGECAGLLFFRDLAHLQD